MNITRLQFTLVLMLTGVLSSFSAPAQALILWDESINGDLSDNGLNPTDLGQLQGGNNTLTATFSLGQTIPDTDYFTFEVPQQLSLEQIILKSFTPEDEGAFFAVQTGNVFDFIFTGPDATGLLGFLDFGQEELNTDILDDMGRANLSPIAPGATGFTPPLPTGQYSFWLRQGGERPVTVTLDFVTSVPEPSTVIGLEVILGLGCAALLKRNIFRKKV